MNELNLLDEPPAKSPTPTASIGKSYSVSQPFNPDEVREAARGDLARGLLWLLTFAIGGVLAFVGLGRLDGTVITQSIFPSLVALAGTALGFYFGSSAKSSADAGAAVMNAAGGAAPAAGNRTPPVANAGLDRNVTAGATVTLKGSGSAGAGGMELGYTWTLTNIPNGSQAALVGANTASPTFSADQPGTYVAQLIVNDGLASSPSTTNITAAPA
ncbi:MAG: PKD domain-containing protein [Bryobacteraceae bacterium]